MAGTETDKFTIPQASAALDIPIPATRRMVEIFHIGTTEKRNKQRLFRVLNTDDLVALSFAAENREKFRSEFLIEVLRALEWAPQSRPAIKIGTIYISFDEHRKRVEHGLKKLAQLDAQVVDEPGVGPVLRGTNIEVHRLAALAEGGASIDHILDDYPSLTKDQVEIALAYAKAHPKLGKPYPKLSAKTAMRNIDLSGLED